MPLECAPMECVVPLEISISVADCCLGVCPFYHLSVARNHATVWLSACARKRELGACPRNRAKEVAVHTNHIRVPKWSHIAPGSMLLART